MYCGDLKQSTAVTVPLGPHVDATDGFTAETSLTVNQAAVRVRKNGGAAAQVNQSTTAPHDENGYYLKALDTTDTNTLGTLQISTHVSGARPVVHSFRILPAWQYDAMYSTTPTITVDQFKTTKGTILRDDTASGVGLKVQGPSDGSGFGMLVQGDQTALSSVPASSTGTLSSAAGAGLMVISRTNLVAGGNAAWFHNATNDGAAIYAQGHDSCAGIHIDGGKTAPAVRMWGGGRHFVSSSGTGLEVLSGSSSGSGVVVTGQTVGATFTNGNLAGTTFGTGSIGMTATGVSNQPAIRLGSVGEGMLQGVIKGYTIVDRLTATAVGTNTITFSDTPQGDSSFDNCIQNLGLMPRSGSGLSPTVQQPYWITEYDGTTGTATFYPDIRANSPLQTGSERVDLVYMVNERHSPEAEPTSAPASDASPAEKAAWLAMMARNKIVQTSTTQTVYADDETTEVATADMDRQETEFTRGEFS